MSRATASHTALFIGEGDLLVSCVELYQELGGRPVGILSSDITTREWAEKMGIKYQESLDAFQDPKWIDDIAFDYLFSISNVDPIPARFIQLAKRDCINFFEGPPDPSRSSRRILSCVSEFPIKWHRISIEKAEPQTLISSTVSISDEETTASLNQKIIETGLDGFAETIRNIERAGDSKVEKFREDDLSKVSRKSGESFSFGPYVWLDWSMSADQLCRYVRASKCNGVTNYCGLVKFEDRGRLYVINDCSVVRRDIGDKTNGNIGEIKDVTSHSIKVKTGDGDLEIFGITDLDGKTVDMPAFFNTGYTFGKGAEEEFSKLQYHIAEKWAQQARLIEPEIVNELKAMRPFEIPVHWKKGIGLSSNTYEETFQFSESLAFPVWSPSFANRFESGAWLAGTLADFIHRLTGQDQLTIAVSSKPFFPTEKAWLELVCPFLPVHWHGKADQPIQDGWWQHREAILKSAQRGIFLRDLFSRSPELNGSESKGLLSLLMNCYVGSLADIESLSCQPFIGIEQSASGNFRFFVNAGKTSKILAVALTKAFHVFYKSISENPGLEIPFVNIGTPGVVKRLDADFTFDKPDSASVVDFIESQSQRNPDLVAVQFDASQMTYTELWEHSGHYASQLQKNGIKLNTCVGLYTNKSIEYIVAFIAILRSGACVVPLRRSLPSERLKSMVEIAGITTVLAKENDLDDKSDWFNELQLLEVSLDKESDFAFPERVAIDHDSLAYVIFTSGSTGIPKPVQVGHRELLHHMLSFSRALSIESNDTVLQFAGLAFDVSIEEIIPTLSMGATLLVSDERNSSDLNLFWQTITKHQVSILNLPTAFWYSLIAETALSDIPNCIKHIIVGGEKVSSSYLEQWFELCKLPITLWNGYGPTETTITATLNPIKEFNSKYTEEQVVPLGYGLGCCDIFVCDAFRKPLPVDIPGEILITGQGVSRGYLNLPGLNKKSFLQSPMVVTSVDYGRAYKSGDFGYISKDHSLHFFGRTDSQVKIRGFRLELSEVEKLIETHVDVEKAIVIDVDSVQSSSKALAAFIKWRRGSALSLADLRKDISASMPEYMVPTFFEPISIWPRTPNGKIDIHSLRGMIKDSRSESAEANDNLLVKSLTRSQHKLLQIWDDILGGKPYSLEDNFFHYGGDSLNAMRFLARVGKEFSCNITLSEFYEKPDIESLSLALDKLENSSSECGQNETNRLSISLSQSESSYPVFILPGGAGGDIEIFIYKALAETLGQDLNVYTFQPLKPGMETFPYKSVEDLSEDIFNEMREIQPTGPYFIVGDCIGSVLLFEIAYKLENMNEEVKSLSLLDTQPGYHERALNTSFSQKYQEFVVKNPWFGKLSRGTGYFLGLFNRGPWNWVNYVNELKQERKRQIEMFSRAQESSQIPKSKLPEALGTTYFEMLCKSTPKKIRSALNDFLPDTKKELEISKTWRSVTSGNYSQSFYKEPSENDFQGRIFDYLRDRKKEAMPGLRKQLIKDGVFKTKN